MKWAWKLQKLCLVDSALLDRLCLAIELEIKEASLPLFIGDCRPAPHLSKT